MAEKTDMPDQISMQIVLRLRQIIQILSRHSKFIQDNYKITIPQLLCLQEIKEQSPISTGALTKIVFMNNSTVTGIVDRLEKRGLIRRNRISNDRRKIHLEISETGMEFLKNAPTPLNERFVKRVKDLNLEQVKNILWVLEMLVDMLGENKSEKVMQQISPPLSLSENDFDSPPDI